MIYSLLQFGLKRGHAGLTGGRGGGRGGRGGRGGGRKLAGGRGGRGGTRSSLMMELIEPWTWPFAETLPSLRSKEKVTAPSGSAACIPNGLTVTASVPFSYLRATGNV